MIKESQFPPPTKTSRKNLKWLFVQNGSFQSTTKTKFLVLLNANSFREPKPFIYIENKGCRGESTV